MKTWRYPAAFVICLMALACNPSTALAADAPPDTTPAYVPAPTDEELRTDVLYGTRVVIPEGTRYYASADGGGSGGYGTIGNRYTPMGTDLYVGGFARLDDSDRLTEYLAYDPPYVPVADYWQNDTDRSLDWEHIWVAIYLDPDGITPIGWVPARTIAVVNGILGDDKTNADFKNGVIIADIDDNGDPNPNLVDSILPDPGNMIEDRVIQGQDNPNPDDNPKDDPFISTREIAYAIEDYTDNGEKVALLLDASRSVSAYVSDIASYGNYVDKVNKADIIIAFGKDFKVISAEEYLDTNIDGGGTDIYAPLSSLTDASSYDRIIMVTDTQHNTGSITMQNIPNFTGKIVVVCPGTLDAVMPDIVRQIESAFKTTVYLCRLDNELDHIQALEALRRAA